MDISIKNFIETLYIQKAVYEELTQLAAEKKQVLISNDIQRLNEITSQEELLVKKAKQAENEMQAEAVKAAKALGIESEESNISTIAEKSDSFIKNRLLEAKEALSGTVKKLAALNDINKELILTHINYTNFSMEIMTQSAVSAETYGVNGYVNEDKSTRIGLIDQKV